MPWNDQGGCSRRRVHTDGLCIPLQSRLDRIHERMLPILERLCTKNCIKDKHKLQSWNLFHAPGRLERMCYRCVDMMQWLSPLEQSWQSFMGVTFEFPAGSERKCIRITHVHFGGLARNWDRETSQRFFKSLNELVKNNARPTTVRSINCEWIIRGQKKVQL